MRFVYFSRPGTVLMLAGALLAPATATGAASHQKKAVHGAIAYDPAHRAVGYSYDFKSDREARIEALRQCGESNCEVLVSFRNACGAVARGPARAFAATGVTRAEAETRALRRCGDAKCAIAAWACTR